MPLHFLNKLIYTHYYAALFKIFIIQRDSSFSKRPSSTSEASPSSATQGTMGIALDDKPPVTNGLSQSLLQC